MTATEAITRLREVIRRQHKALATGASHVQWLRRYIIALRGTAPTLTRDQNVEQFFTALAQRQAVAASAQKQTFNAIALFYNEVLGAPLQKVDALHATTRAYVDHTPTLAETHTLLQAFRVVAGQS